MEHNNNQEQDELLNEKQIFEEQEASEQDAYDETEEGEDEQDSNPESKKRRRRSRPGAKKIKDLEEENAKLQAELSEAKDKYLRLYAEFDNYRKRTHKEKDELVKVASQKSILAMLPTLDDFERAMRAAQENQGEALPEGIVLIYEKLFRNLEGQGLKPMESTGQAFDPDLHEALTKIPAPNDELKGKVLDTLERGYYLNDKIIRYAKVVVAQ